MFVDVSEIKAFRTCRRQWMFSSRNRFHLTAKVPPAAFAFGTLFHEAVHQLYLGVDIEKVMKMVTKEMNGDDDRALMAMVPGYAREVIPGDLDRFKVLDIEHRFAFQPEDNDGNLIFPTLKKNGEPPLTITGSIDMIVLDEAEEMIYGFEHKTCKTFRDGSYLWMDEQPRVYFHALKLYVKKYNETHSTNYKAGGVYLNEVKKLLRDFQYNRTLCVYPDDDMDNFMEAFIQSCLACKHSVETNDKGTPNPSFFNCQMCMFKDVCQTYMYRNVKEAELLQNFSDEFVKRTIDHLEEKVERGGE